MVASVVVAPGAVALASLAVDHLLVECTRCPRRGRYRVAGLLAEHGADIGLPMLASILSADCPQRRVTDLSRRCDLLFPQLLRATD